MDTIVSKTSIKFYLKLSLPPIGLVLLGLFLFFSGQDEEKGGGVLMFFGLLLMVFAVYHIWRYLKNCPTIGVNDREISFNGFPYFWSEITDVRLTATRQFPYIVDAFNTAATTIHLKNGEIRCFYDFCYSNSWEIKQFIQQHFLQKESTQTTYMPFSPIIGAAAAESLLDIEVDAPQTFSGYQLGSLHGFTAWILPVIWLGTSLKNMWAQGFEYHRSSILYPSLLLLLPISYLAFTSLQLNYFQVSSRFLIVRTHNLFWIKRRFRFSDMEEIIFEQQGNTNLPVQLRIVFCDFKQKAYPAGTLKKATWKALQAQLEAYGVKVRNDLP